VIELAVATLLAHQPLAPSIVEDLILHHHHKCQRVGHNLAFQTGNDIEEYRSVAVTGLVRAANGLTHKTCPRPENDGISKYLISRAKGEVLNFMKRDRVVFNYQHEFVTIQELSDDTLDAGLEDIHDFLGDLVSLVTNDPKIKQMLMSVGRGKSIAESAEIGGLSAKQAQRALIRIRNRYQRQL